MKITAALIKRRLTRAKREIDLWRKRLRIDPKWDISVAYTEVDDDPALSDALLAFDDKKAEYWNVTIVLFKKLVEDPDFNETIGSCVSHELDHLRMWQYSSFARNLTRGDEGMMRELNKLEEQIVQQNEEIWGSVKWR